MLALLCLTALPAQAGYYKATVITNGTIHLYNGDGSSTMDNPYGYDLWHNGAYFWGEGEDTYIDNIPGNAYYSYWRCGGLVKVRFDWQSDNGNAIADPPPSSAIVVQSSEAAGWGNGPFYIESYDSGLPNSPLMEWIDGWGNYNSDSTGAYYTVHGGQSFEVSCTPVADTADDDWYSSVAYSVSVYPVIANLVGTTFDTSNQDNILVGQVCQANLVTLPLTPDQQSAWTWSVSGSKFQSWSDTTPAIGNTPANPEASYYVGGAGPLNLATAEWCWNDLGPDSVTETVTCSATVTPPAGEGDPFSVSATKKVKVQMPTVTAVGKGGYMQVNTSAPGYSNYSLWAGPTAPMIASNQLYGMNWEAIVTTPTTPSFGAGQLEIVQIVTPNDSYTTLTTPVQSPPDPLNGITGLDLIYPYGNHIYTEAPQSSYKDDDSPGLHLLGLGPAHNLTAASAAFSSSYKDYLMYCPPGDADYTEWVPVKTFTWRTNGSATIPTTHSWSDYVTQHGSDAAVQIDLTKPTVSPNTATLFDPPTGPTDYPSWTQIEVPGDY